MSARTAAKKGSAGDSSGRGEIRRLIAEAIMQTRKAFEGNVRWHEQLERPHIRVLFAKARSTKDARWRTRFLQQARRLKAWRAPRWQREAWPSKANRIEIWPDRHAWNCDRVHVRFYDSRGVPVISLSASGTLDFIDGLAQTVSAFVDGAERDGRLDLPGVTVYCGNEECALPPAAKGL